MRAKVWEEMSIEEKRTLVAEYRREKDMSDQINIALVKLKEARYKEQKEFKKLEKALDAVADEGAPIETLTDALQEHTQALIWRKFLEEAMKV